LCFNINTLKYEKVNGLTKIKWGEWFENWSLIDNKPTIIKQGWQ